MNQPKGTTMKTQLTLFTLLLTLPWITGCGSQQNTPSTSGAADATPATSTTLQQTFVSTAPEGEAQPIPLARTTAKPGESIVLEGKIMGVMHPFVEGRAVFVLGDDATISSCDENPEDGCETPWDACCDPDEVLKAGVATIQVLDVEGKVLKEDIKGVNGLKELSKVRIAGTLAEQSNADAMIVNATAIYLLP
jgi:hypothetical protein